MPYIEWTEVLSVGDEDIDAQHKEWIRIINDLHKNLLDESGGELGKVTTRSLEAMYAYGLKHFAFEEKCMLKADYPNYDFHKKLHDEFKTRISLLIEEHNQKNTIVLNSQLMKVLKNWLEQHILVEDKKVFTYIHSQDSAD